MRGGSINEFPEIRGTKVPEKLNLSLIYFEGMFIKMKNLSSSAEGTNKYCGSIIN